MTSCCKKIIPCCVMLQLITFQTNDETCAGRLSGFVALMKSCIISPKERQE